jgi:hypothetical protein
MLAARMVWRTVRDAFVRAAIAAFSDASTLVDAY